MEYKINRHDRDFDNRSRSLRHNKKTRFKRSHKPNCSYIFGISPLNQGSVNYQSLTYAKINTTTKFAIGMIADTCNMERSVWSQLLTVRCPKPHILTRPRPTYHIATHGS